MLPSSFQPDEDQGFMYISMQLPEASSIQNTSEATRVVEDILKSTPGVKYYSTYIGFSLLSLTRRKLFLNRPQWRLTNMKRTFGAAGLRYRGGSANYLEILTNETNAYNAELPLTQAQLNELLQLVEIYKNLGGG